MLLWSASFVGTRIAYRSFGPFTLAFVRFTIAALAYVPYLVAHRADIPRGRNLRIIAATGLVGISLYYAAENVGLKLTSASNASLVTASFPAIALLMEAAVHRHRPSTRALAGSLVAIAGVGLISWGESSAGADVILGNAILMLGGVSWGAYNLLVQAIDGHVGTVLLTALQTVFGALFFVPVLAFEGFTAIAIGPDTIVAVVFLALGCSVAAYLLYNFALTGLPASTCSSLLNLIPIFGVILSAIVLGEVISAVKLVGGAVVLAGIALSTMRAQK